METVSGSCGCGEIKFECEGAPINTAFCYCHSCQKHTNSDKWFGIWYANNKFKVTTGEPSKYIRTGDSGKNVAQPLVFFVK